MVADGRELVELVTVAVLIVGAEVDVVQLEIVLDMCADGLFARC